MKAALRSFAIAGLLLCATATQARAATCFVAAVNLVFGSYNQFNVVPADSSGHVAVTCNGTTGETVAYVINFNPGGSGTYSPRRLRSNSTFTLDYNIYVDAARTSVWGNGTGGTLAVSDSYALAASSVAKYYPTYGRVVARQNVPPGLYSDSIVITLNF